MKRRIVPLLSGFEESQRLDAPLCLQDEITFVGTVYKSILLDLTIAVSLNAVSKWTKVREETTDDE